MSASLVGSEMCIRDSASPLGRAGGPFSPLHLQSGPVGRAANRKPGAEAVSYTHLTLPTICSV
eukprot:4606486-Alexandrium_andersonii.AAC.1